MDVSLPPIRAGFTARESPVGIGGEGQHNDTPAPQDLAAVLTHYPGLISHRLPPFLKMMSRG